MKNEPNYEIEVNQDGSFTVTNIDTHETYLVEATDQDVQLFLNDGSEYQWVETGWDYAREIPSVAKVHYTSLDIDNMDRLNFCLENKDKMVLVEN